MLKSGGIKASFAVLEYLGSAASNRRRDLLSILAAGP
jgi:hypothetical protein